MRKVRHKYLTSVSPSYHDRDILPDSGKAWRFAHIDSQWYYAYNNIPDKAPQCYRSLFPSQNELIEQYNCALTTSATSDLEAFVTAHINDHASQYLTYYNDCTEAQQANLCRAAATMEAAITFVRMYGVNTSKSAFYDQLAQVIHKNDIKYIGENTRVLQRKLQEILSGQPITEVIKLPRANNENASKGYSDEEVRSWIIQLRSLKGLNYTNTFIIKKIQDMCALSAKPCPSDRWIGAIMEERNVDFLTSEERFGKTSRFNARYRGYQPFKNALFAGDCWQVDGTRVNIIGHKGEDKTGKKVRQYLYIITVRDVHSGDVLGYHFDLVENRWGVFSAVRMAAKEAGYLPWEIVFDKFPGHDTPEMKNFLGDLQQWGVKVTLSSDPNVKPNLERWFGTLQTAFMQESHLYYGQGVKSRRKYAHRGEDYIKRLNQQAWKMGFDFNDATNESIGIIEAYRQAPYSSWSRKHKKVVQSPAQLHEISEKPNVVALNQEDYYYLFGLKAKMNIDGKGLIKKEISGTTFYYRCTDYEVYSKHDKVLVSYDLDDLSQVMLFAIADGPVRQFLGRAYEETPAQRYGPDAEWGTIARRSALLKEISWYREQEQEYRKAAGDDITVLLAPMSVNKAAQEAAETNYLNQQYSGNAPELDDTDDLDINFRNQY